MLGRLITDKEYCPKKEDKPLSNQSLAFFFFIRQVVLSTLVKLAYIFPTWGLTILTYQLLQLC